MAKWAFNQQGLKMAATIHDGSAYAEALQQVFADEFTALGGRSSSRRQCPRTSRHEPGADRDRGGGPSSCTSRSSPPRVVSSSPRHWRSRASKMILIGSDGMFTPDFVKAAGPAPKACSSQPGLLGFRDGYAALLESPGQVREDAGHRVPRPCVRRGEHPVRRDREGRGQGRRRHAIVPRRRCVTPSTPPRTFRALPAC